MSETGGEAALIACAEAAAAGIINDLGGRRGLCQEWDQIDPDTQAEIWEAWAQIIAHEMRRLTAAASK